MSRVYVPLGDDEVEMQSGKRLNGSSAKGGPQSNLIQTVNLGLAGAILGFAALVCLWFLILDAPILNAVKCDDNNMCTRDYVIGAPAVESCDHRPAFRSTDCHDACFLRGHCDGLGNCTNGDPTACKGFCDANNDDTCDNLFAWNVNVVDYFLFADLEPFTFCYADQCIATAWAFWGVGEIETVIEGGIAPPILDCLDFLDPDFLAANRSCIVTSKRFVDPYSLSEFVEAPTTDTIQMCSFAWACSKFDAVAFNTFISSSVASLATARFQNRTQGQGRNATKRMLRGELPRDYQWPLSGQLHVALSGTWKTTQHPAAIIIVLLTRKEYDSLSEQLRSRWGVQLGDGAHGREHYFQLDDAPTATEFPATLRACVALLQQMHQHDKRPCLVHCYAGVSRSASVVIAYLMTRYALKAQDAYALVEQRRPCINPNPYFERELFAYERELFPPPPQ